MRCSGSGFALLVIGAVGCAVGLPVAGPPDAPARLAYRVECIADGVDDRLVVDLRVTGLDPAQRDLAFELPLWGEWLELDEYYVRRVSGTPPVVHDLANRFFWRPQLPTAWDQTLAVHYELPIVAVRSVAHDSHGLLPWRCGDYVNGYSANTLMRLLVGDARQDAARALELVAPDGWSVASGSSAPDRTVAVRDLLLKLRAVYRANTGSPPPSAENVFLLEPGMGGTHTEGAISMGWPELGADGRFETGTAHFIAHESFHAWLPGVLRPADGVNGAGLEWFFEGFTDYFSLWHLASVGAITAQQFADQLRPIEMIGLGSPAWGEGRFRRSRDRLARARPRGGRLSRWRAARVPPRCRAAPRRSARPAAALPQLRRGARLALRTRDA
ncbi:MAG: hypothetical protein EXS13_12630 [Planctomycetes bacterium]|nr:hypothetical protein [Planctomycetota bacterium]